MTRWVARSSRSLHGSSDPLEPTLLALDPLLVAALEARGLVLLASEMAGIRSRDALRRASVWRALAAGTDVDVVRERPSDAAPPTASGEPILLDYAGASELRVDEALEPWGLELPAELLAVLFQPIVAGLLVDEGCARDLGTAEPLVLAREASILVTPRLDDASRSRALLVTRGERSAAAHARRGARARAGRALARALALEPSDRVVVHLPLGEGAIEEARSLLGALA